MKICRKIWTFRFPFKYIYIYIPFHVLLENQRDGMEREVGGGFRLGNMCTPVVDSC